MLRPSYYSTLVLFPLLLTAAPRDRINRAVDARQTHTLAGTLHRLAQPEFDRGAVDPGLPIQHVVLLIKPSPAQQSELDLLLADQQNPSTPLFHHWLTPEEFGGRFGLSLADAGKVSAWLKSEGLAVHETARGRNWFAFTGTAAQVERALHAPIHRFHVDGETHFAIAAEPSIPAALADVVAGFIGLDDFQLRSQARIAPAFTSGSSHFLAPDDFSTIYNLAPLYAAGLDGAGQRIAIVGQTAPLLSDLRSFRARFNLPAADPTVMLYGGADPGINGALIEADLDLEWAGAIAPKAALYYVYGANAFTATVAAINLNLAPIISISYGTCEVNAAPSAYRSIAQQGNAQGITLLAASGDSGSASCDSQGSEITAARGRAVLFPAVMPEVTAVGGTQFVEGTGTYWTPTNNANSGSALSYIPEAAWNESDAGGLISTGGGVSAFYPRPAWQTGPGVPTGAMRTVPDVALSAALHDAYLVTYLGGLNAVGGTSASAPSLAGVIALLNQYQVSKGFQSAPGLGNINPQLYRLAQSAPAAFHDITAGSNIVTCAQGSPDCLTGSIGYEATIGYDLATGLGSINASNLVTQWNTATSPVSINLFVNSSRVTLNDTIGMTALFLPIPTAAFRAGDPASSAVPTGRVDFVSGTIPLGSSPVITRNGQQVADLFFPAYLLGTGTFTLGATYSGDAAFSSGGATRTITVIAGTGAAAVLVSAPNTVWAYPPEDDPQGAAWQTTLTVRELASVVALITGFTIDGQAQPLSQYFPSPNLTPGGSVSSTFVFRNLAAPVARVFGITGVDSVGNTWSRQVTVNYFPVPNGLDFNPTITPAVVVQNPSADPACQWQAQISLDESGGFSYSITTLRINDLNYSTQIAAIFGTTRLDAYSSLQGKLCFGGIKPPANAAVFIGLSSGQSQWATLTFAPAPVNPTRLSVSPASITLAKPSAGQPAEATLTLDIADKTAPWTATLWPANRTTGWLSLSRQSGSGPAQITLTATGTDYAPGAYRAMLLIQSEKANPQYLTVPIMYVLGGSSSGTAIASVANAISYQPTASPGMLLSVFGTKLANTTATASGSPAALSFSGVTATVNNLAAPVLYASPTQLNILVPFEAGAGPAVLGINNNGEVAGFQFQIAPSAPGIYDGLKPTKRGDIATLYLTGAGDVTLGLRTFFYPSATTPAAGLPKPFLPVSVTVGGVPALLQFLGHAPGLFGLTQINVIVPPDVTAGVQPVVVTIGGVPSPPVNLTVQ